LPIVNLLYFFRKKKHVKWYGIGVLTVFFFIFSYGSYNAWTPIVRTYEITVNKKSPMKDVKIFMASDLHLGSVVGVNHLKRLVHLANVEKPDLVLLAGDIINDNIDPFLQKNMGKMLAEIKAPLGIYAVLGNHDYYGGDSINLKAELNKRGITVLMDEYVNINDSFYLVGRKEHTDPGRKFLQEYLQGLDKNKPIIMMDHQPKDLKEAEENGVDLLLSGHTHRGQLAPANFLTNAIFENDWGHLAKGNFHSLVSSGFGLWGPPLRIGSQAEVLVIDVRFAKSS
jgi:predicted MPP superfamily phosphohydrolase